MNSTENPYQAPECIDDEQSQGWVARLVAAIGRVGFWLGVWQAVSGLVISFVPGAECQWYLTAALLIVVGGLVPKWRYRIAAIVLCLACLYFSYAGYLKGVEYRIRLEKAGVPLIQPLAE